METTLVVLFCFIPSLYGGPLNKRFLGLFGISIPNPADLSGLYNIKVPGDATGYLDISHQQQSAAATGTGYVQHQNHNGPGSFNLQTGGSNMNSLPGKCDQFITTHCDIDCRQIDSVTGCVTCKSGCRSNTQATSGGVSSVTSISTTASPMCPAFPGTCPRGSVAVVNGCPICTAQLATQQTTTAQAPSTCAPVRCVTPCNKGIMLGSDGCPVCVC
ncbi:uncharacterized protein LOC133198861 [Saccostrea echinata]|uniref:uncharacterized protein LOC133198861 n=1 Tax=Saccostrea echinata TaxID=191078 RepID=UPI002A7F6352|nr:uncharacterized protein LOC133198861 [Saccostrea echinata]